MALTAEQKRKVEANKQRALALRAAKRQRPADADTPSTPTAAQPYFDDDSAPGATLYESPVGRAVEY